MTGPANKPHETRVGEVADYWTNAHPPRSDSNAYKASRKWLMTVAKGGCIVCGGLVDLAHPEAPANAKGLEDHHGGALYFRDVLVGYNLFGLEWSLGWSADPKRVSDFIALLKAAGFAQGWDKKVETTADVMEWVDSVHNANLKACKAHHVGTQHQHTPDANGHEAVGIHEIPFPIWLGQVTCQWDVFDMWAGTTGTLAVSRPPHLPPGEVQVEHVHDGTLLKTPEGTPLRRGVVLPPTHPHARSAHHGYRPAVEP